MTKEDQDKEIEMWLKVQFGTWDRHSIDPRAWGIPKVLKVLREAITALKAVSKYELEAQRTLNRIHKMIGKSNLDVEEFPTKEI